MSEFKKDFIKKANETIDSVDYKVSNNHEGLLKLFDLSDRKNIDARKFDGLYKDSQDGVHKYRDQLEILGEVFKKLDTRANSFIIAAIEKDKDLKEGSNDLIPHSNFIDMKELIVMALKNPQISGVSSIESLSMLREIYSPDTIKGKTNAITSGMDATPIINAINAIDIKEINEDEIKKIKDVLEIIEKTSDRNASNDSKINEIKDMINKIEEDFKLKNVEEINLEENNEISMF